MKVFIRYSLVFLQTLILVACSQAQPAGDTPGAAEKHRGIAIEGVVIRNKLPYPVTGVQLLVLSSGDFVGCGNIMSRSACATTFPVRDYYSDKVVVTWQEYGKEHSTGEFVIQTPDEYDPGRPAQLEVIIFMMGEAGAKLVQ